MNYKGLRYRTEWVEYPDIAALCQKIGAGPTGTHDDGSPYYSLPVLHDPTTNRVIPDSTAIADYLDQTYPDTPLLFPPGTRGLVASYQTAMGSILAKTQALWKLVVLRVCLNLNERSHGYFRRTREADEGMRLEEIAPEGEVRERTLKEFEEELTKIGKWYEVGGGGPFIMGDRLCYADILLAGHLTWVRVSLGKESEEWKRIAGFAGGFPGRFIEQFEKYQHVV